MSAGQQLLSSKEPYDEDTASLHSGTDGDFDSDDDEPYSLLRDPEKADRKVLEEVEEEENLLKKPGRAEQARNIFGKKDNVQRRKRLNNQRARRLKQDAEGSGNAELIYEMEGGFEDSSLRTSSESLILETEKWNREPSSGKPFKRWVLVPAGIIILFLLLAYGSFNASQHKNVRPTSGNTIFTNGTHLFGPTTILISLDGFRADFLQRGLTPAMRAFVESGVSPQYMMPSFPSLTFPNHFTLVTGLYPESHGIVSNQFWDPVLEEEFYYTHINNSMQPKWWNAEPIWVTAEKAGLKAAIHMWPGSEAHIGNHDPAYLDKFNATEALDIKVHRILEWLDKPIKDRPQFIGAYVPNVDADGHKYGPNSTEIRATIVEVDSMLTSLVEGLLQRNLTEVVNLVIVSDHGMATTSNDRLIQLDDFIDMSLVDHIDGWPLRGLRLKNPDRDVPVLHQQLLKASKNNRFDVYTLETMPERYHFSKNQRIAPLWVVPHTGWAVVEKDDFDITEAKASGTRYEPIGLHGYDHEDPLMRAIFIARGPAFPHPPNSRVAPFQNIEVYNIVCDSLGIKPHPNNGTLRLPLATQGLHSDFHEPEQIFDDPVHSTTQIIQTTVHTTKASTIGNPKTAGVVATILSSSATPSGGNEAGHSFPPEIDPPEADPKTGTARGSWWDFLHNKLDQAKQWAKEMIDSIRNNNSSKTQPHV